MCSRSIAQKENGEGEGKLGSLGCGRIERGLRVFVQGAHTQMGGCASWAAPSGTAQGPTGTRRLCLPVPRGKLGCALYPLGFLANVGRVRREAVT